MYIRTCSTGGRDANYSGHGHGSGHELFFPSGSRFFFFFFSIPLFALATVSGCALSGQHGSENWSPTKRRAQKTSIEVVSSGLPFAQLACPPCTSLKTASSLRMPGGFCAKAAADNIDSRTSPRLSSGSARGQLYVLSSAQTEAQVMSRVCITDLIATDRQPVANRLDDRDSPAEG